MPVVTSALVPTLRVGNARPGRSASREVVGWTEYLLAPRR
jgi:hypothetical protein